MQACNCASDPHGIAAGEHLPLLPAFVLVLLPKCPLCLGAWFGILGSIGVGSWLRTFWGAPLAAALLSFAIGALALRAWRSRDACPLLLGLVGAAALLGGRSFWDAPLLLYAGLVLLMGASLWSSWSLPRGRGSVSARKLVNTFLNARRTYKRPGPATASAPFSSCSRAPWAADPVSKP